MCGRKARFAGKISFLAERICAPCSGFCALFCSCTCFLYLLHCRQCLVCPRLPSSMPGGPRLGQRRFAWTSRRCGTRVFDTARPPERPFARWRWPRDRPKILCRASWRPFHTTRPWSGGGHSMPRRWSRTILRKWRIFENAVGPHCCTRVLWAICIIASGGARLLRLPRTRRQWSFEGRPQCPWPFPACWNRWPFSRTRLNDAA